MRVVGVPAEGPLQSHRCRLGVQDRDTRGRSGRRLRRSFQGQPSHERIGGEQARRTARLVGSLGAWPSLCGQQVL